MLRRQPGDVLRIFNGQDGEWLGEITDLGKKGGAFILTERIKDQPKAGPRRHLIFAPIKKQRLDILIEKAVELGVTDLHPALTNRTESRKINENRIHAQTIEAAEQCERLDVPVLHTMEPLMKKVTLWQGPPIFAALERTDAPALAAIDMSSDAAFLIGPEGGFDESEIGFLTAQESVRPVTLGRNILRAETAALACLAYAGMAAMENILWGQLGGDTKSH